MDATIGVKVPKLSQKVPKYLISPTDFEEEEDNSRMMTHMPITNTYVNRGDGLGFDPSYAFHSVGNKYGGPVAGSEWRFHCHGEIFRTNGW